MIAFREIVATVEAFLALACMGFLTSKLFDTACILLNIRTMYLLVLAANFDGVNIAKLQKCE